MKIGILMCGHFTDEIKARYGTYRDLYADMLGEGFECTPYVIVDGAFPDSITEQDGWLVSGSRSGAYEDHPWIPPLEAFLREAYAAEVPIVGICLFPWNSKTPPGTLPTPGAKLNELGTPPPPGVKVL